MRCGACMLPKGEKNDYVTQNIYKYIYI